MPRRHHRGLLCWGLALLAACASGPATKEAQQAEIQYDLGVENLRAGRLREALREFLESEKVRPNFPELQNALGLTYYMLGDFEAALHHFERALQLKPDFSEVLNNQAQVFIAQGRFRLAVPLLERALQDVFLKERFLAEGNLGWALFRLGEKEQAYRHVKNALAQNERFCVGYHYLGLMLQEDKDLQQATDYLRQALQQCPDFLEAKRDLGKVLLLLGDVGGGCKKLQECWQPARLSPLGQDCERLWRQNCAGGQPPSPE